MPTVKCSQCLVVFTMFSGKVSVGSNSNILESSVITALEPSAVSIGSDVVIEQVDFSLLLFLIMYISPLHRAQF